MKYSIKKILTDVMLASLLLAICLGFASCAGGDDDIPRGMQSATLPGEYFTFLVPASWCENTECGKSAAFYSYDDLSSVMAESDTGDYATPEEYYKAVCEEDYRSTFANYTLESSDSTKLGDADAYSVNFSFENGEKTYYCRQVISLVEKRFYIVTYSSDAKDKFDSHTEQVELILANFIYKPTAPSKKGNDKRIDKNTPAGMQIASEDDLKYYLFVPDTWCVDNLGIAAGAYVSESDRSNITAIEYMPEEQYSSIDDYWKNCESEYKNTIPGYKFISQSDTVIGGKNGKCYLYSSVIGGKTYKIEQTVTVCGSRFCVITFTSEESLFDSHADELELIKSSFLFK